MKWQADPRIRLLLETKESREQLRKILSSDNETDQIEINGKTYVVEELLLDPPCTVSLWQRFRNLIKNRLNKKHRT